LYSTDKVSKNAHVKGKEIVNKKQTSFRTFGLLILFLAIFLPSTLFAQQDPYVELRDQAHILATTIVEDLEVFSIQYALMSKGEIILSGNVSNSQYLPPEPYDNDTVYGIGSISKMFSTAAIMQLVDQEIVDLDEPITTYLPEFFMQDQRYLEITVRMLLNHSSGLFGSYLVNGITYNDPNTFNRENMLAELQNQPLKADPGAFSVYCNDGFTLIELIIERVSGLSYSEYIRENIAVPLTLTHTSTPENNPSLEKLAKTYRHGKVTPPETFNIFATGGVYSTAENLCQFGHIFMDSPGSDSMQEFLSDQAKQSLRNKEYALGMWPELDANMLGYGLGWDSVDLYPFDRYGIQALVKGGDTTLYHGSIIVLPEYDLVFAALLSGGASFYGMVMGQELLLQTLLAKGDIETKLPPYEIASYDRVAVPLELYA
jgi:CubicO group peptidase (beta-lactamase class C family)